jgi:general secretion pathway protein L
MNILAIDLGTYAVKYAYCVLEKKQIILQSQGLVVIDEIRKDLPEDLSLEEIQLDIVKNFVTEFPDSKIITHIPVDMITTRYLSLPVNNKKKAQLMIPFQLDENLPFPVSEAHYSSYVQKIDDHSEAQVSIAPIAQFEEFYRKLESNNIMPHLMASELAFIQSYAEQSPNSGSYAIIDIGHQFTKGYFIHNKNVISNHLSYIAGSVIDDVISETYEIPLDQAVTYKHQNCFLLTDAQYETVNKDQKEFALLMKQIFTPLIQDLKRWELGFRVKYGRPVDRIYITGGTSNINNISNFLSIELGLKVEHLPEPHDFILDDDILEESGNLLSSIFTMTASQRAKNPPSNMLSGNFSGSTTASLPIHSTSFILSRALILLVVFSLFMGAEKIFFLNAEEKKLSAKVTKLLKNPSLALKRRDRTDFKNNPAKLLKKLKNKNSQVIKEIETIKKALKVNALKSLSELHTYLSKNENIHLTLFESANGNIKTEFRSKTADDLKVLQRTLADLPLIKKKIKYSSNNPLFLSMDFSEDQ